MICSPEMEPGLVSYPVSNIDLTPTLCDLANVSIEEIAPWCEGESLVHLGQGGERTNPVAMEYAAEASFAPMVSLRYGPWKFNRCSLDRDQLFNLDNDHNELEKLVNVPKCL